VNKKNPVAKWPLLFTGFGLVMVCFSLSRFGSMVVTAQNSLTTSESRGKQIYTQGTSPSGKDVFAYLGDPSLELPGSAMPCANCHGLDGHGKPEGGVSPTNLAWEVLTKPYGVTHPNGRSHPPYTERALELAITCGTDPGGNKLLNVMPRYALSVQDLADLVAYLKVVGKDLDPGISERNIVLGTAGPTKGRLADISQASRAVTAAFFDELNSQGGIYDRRFEVKFLETAETPAATRAAMDRWLKDGEIFALSGVVMAGFEKDLLPLIANREVPLIGPLTLYPETGTPLNRQVFYLLSGVEGQARAFVEFAASKAELKNQSIAVVFTQGESSSKLLQAISEENKRAGFGKPRAFDYLAGQFDAASTARQLKTANSNLVFFLSGGKDVLSFLAEAVKIDWYPSIFIVGASSEIFGAPLAFSEKIFLSFPTSPADQSPEGVREFSALAEKYKLPKEHLAAQLSAFSSAKILTEAIRRVGKDLSREKLIQALEGLYEYQTGLTPAITYGPNRRIGAMGAYIIKVDLKEKQFVPAAGWISVN
jgi:ABC-type branched-subunit amino acid transport system substrate-binding protein